VGGTIKKGTVLSIVQRGVVTAGAAHKLKPKINISPKDPGVDFVTSPDCPISNVTDGSVSAFCEAASKTPRHRGHRGCQP
jgi:hypothetical protein